MVSLSNHHGEPAEPPCRAPFVILCLPTAGRHSKESTPRRTVVVSSDARSTPRLCEERRRNDEAIWGGGGGTSGVAHRPPRIVRLAHYERPLAPPPPSAPRCSLRSAHGEPVEPRCRAPFVILCLPTAGRHRKESTPRRTVVVSSDARSTPRLCEERRRNDEVIWGGGGGTSGVAHRPPLIVRLAHYERPLVPPPPSAPRCSLRSAHGEPVEP